VHFNEKSPTYILIPEKDVSFSTENVLVLPEFFKNKYFVRGKSSKNIEFLRNKYCDKGKSPKNV
jgi:hypothetical protein